MISLLSAGITLRGLYEYISIKYSINVTKQRQNLVKKHIVDLDSAGDIIHLTGHGLSGHFKLANKQAFSRHLDVAKSTIKRRRRKARPPTPPQLAQEPEADLFEACEDVGMALPASQVYDLAPTQDQLDTPMVPNRASTPIVQQIFPHAPQPSHHTSYHSNHSVETPRTSLPGRRKFLRRMYKNN